MNDLDETIGQRIGRAIDDCIGFCTRPFRRNRPRRASSLVLVPREPTPEMLAAGDDAGWWSGGANGHEEASCVWAAMIAQAAPTEKAIDTH